MNPEDKASSAHDFDFLVGAWHVRNRRKRGDYFQATPAASAPANAVAWDEFPAYDRIEACLDGRAVLERWEATLPSGEAALGLSMKAFDPATHQWSIVWIDNRNSPDFRPLVGSFEGGVGTFYQVIETRDGQSLRVRFIWESTSANTARWQQAFSFDGGEQWETNWIMEFTRDQESPQQ